MKTRSRRLLSFVVVFSSAAFQVQAVEYKDQLATLSDPDLISSEGLGIRGVVGATTTGYVMGIAGQFVGDVPMGLVAWGSDLSGGPASRLGLYDAEHTSPDGMNISIPLWMNPAGVVVGLSGKGGSSMSEANYWISDLSTGVSHKVGLFGAEYQDGDGSTDTVVDHVSRSGTIAGMSFHNGGGYGSAAWVADATGTTVRVGFFDARHTSWNGQQYSDVVGISDEGLVAGNSDHWNADGSIMGSTAWVADISGNTRQVGFTDGIYADDEGNYSSGALGFASGQLVVGYSEMYSANALVGEATWVTDLNTDTVTRIGLFDAQHTSASGEQNSWVTALPYAEERLFSPGGLFSGRLVVTEESQPDPSATAYIGGGSANYADPGNDSNESAWVWRSDTSTTTRVGLTSGIFTDSNGGEHSRLTDLTSNGIAAGWSSIYDGTNVVGRGAWLADVASGTGTVRVGLTGGKYVHSSGAQQSSVHQVTRSGYAIGTSWVFAEGSENLGNASWAADVSTGETFEVGLSGPEFVRNDGVLNSGVTGITESGVIFGYNSISAGDSWGGEAVWAATMSSQESVRLGLNADAFTAPSGLQYSEITHYTESGYIGGFSQRYEPGGAEFGSTAWVYNAFTGVQTNFDLYLDAASGFSDSTLMGISENGIAYGSFFQGDYNSAIDPSSLYKAFIWSSELGMLVLDDEIGQQIASQGWTSLNSADAVLPNGYIIGWGTLTSGGQGIYLAQIPEVSSLLLAFSGLPLMFRRRRAA